MGQYRYKARNQAGQEVKGTLHAPSEERARALLQAHSLIPISLEVGESRSFLNRDIFSSVSTKDLVMFSRQMSSMISAGVPIIEAIRALVKQVENQSFSKLLETMAYDIEGGESLSQAVSRYPETFSLFFLGVVRTGEASGRLSESLATLADYLEQNYIFIRKVRGALMYPIFVIVLVIVVVALMFIFVMPQLVSLFTEAQVQLPLVTRVLISVTEFTRKFWYLIILVLIALALVARSYLRTPDGQYTTSSFLLRIPVIRSLIEKVYLARLTSILDTLFASDVPVLESLAIAEDSIGNPVYKRILAGTSSAVKDGASLSTVWEHEPYIPAMLTTMVAVGERSGEVQKAFSEAHRFFKRDVEEILESISIFIEPIMVILLGIGVAFVVAGVILPIYNLVLVF